MKFGGFFFRKRVRLMKRQRGQTLVEFALVMPMLALFIFGMIYGALIFVDYMDFSNQARALARQVAVMDEDYREDLFDETPQRIGNFASFYNVTQTITLEKENATDEYPVDVLVKIDFTRNNKDLPNVLKWVGFPPETIRPIKYKMKLEYHINKNSTDTTNTNTTNTNTTNTTDTTNTTNTENTNTDGQVP